MADAWSDVDVRTTVDVMHHSGQLTFYFSFLQRVLSGLRHVTVPQLRDMMKKIQDDGLANITRGGRKSELVDRITKVVRNLQYENRIEHWKKVRDILSPNRQPPELVIICTVELGLAT